MRNFAQAFQGFSVADTMRFDDSSEFVAQHVYLERLAGLVDLFCRARKDDQEDDDRGSGEKKSCFRRRSLNFAKT